MLIIFDLDDTLIDTSGCITHYKLEDALHAMVRAGLAVPDFFSALELLRRIDRFAESSRDAIAEFVDILGFDQGIFAVGVKEMEEGPFPDAPLFPLDGALELLMDLREQHQLALVTAGTSERQMEKLKKAGIDSQLFSKIAVTERGNKKFYYQMIVDDLGFSPSEVLVCADRISADLLPAKELKFKTVHMLWGRGLNLPRKRGDTDYSISKIQELKGIISGLMKFSSI